MVSVLTDHYRDYMTYKDLCTQFSRRNRNESVKTRGMFIVFVFCLLPFISLAVLILGQAYVFPFIKADPRH